MVIPSLIAPRESNKLVWKYPERAGDDLRSLFLVLVRAGEVVTRKDDSTRLFCI